MPQELILFPFGGNARESLIVLSQADKADLRWKVRGFIDDDPQTWDRQCCGIQVLGGGDRLWEYPNSKVLAVPGNPHNYLMRRQIIDRLGLEKERFATIIDPSARIAIDAKIGFNTLIMPNVVISCGVEIGNHCIVLPNTVVSHDSAVGDYTCIGANVTVAGDVRIGSSCYIGSGSKVREKLSIGEKAMTALGAIVVSDVSAGAIVAGNPAKVLRGVDLE